MKGVQTERKKGLFHSLLVLIRIPNGEDVLILSCKQLFRSLVVVLAITGQCGRGGGRGVSVCSGSGTSWCHGSEEARCSSDVHTSPEHTLHLLLSQPHLPPTPLSLHHVSQLL